MVLAVLALVSSCSSPPIVVVTPGVPVAQPLAPQTQSEDAVPGRSASSGSASGSPAVAGDLGLSQAMSTPSCDGSYITVVGSAVKAPYASQVREFLDDNPGSAYLRTDQTCSSLRASMPSGEAIYAAFFGPFGELSSACAKRDEVGGDAYVKVLDRVTDSSRIQDCTSGTSGGASIRQSSADDPYGCLAADRAGLASYQDPCAAHFQDSADPTRMEPDTPATRWALCHQPASADDPDYIVGGRARYCS